MMNDQEDSSCANSHQVYLSGAFVRRAEALVPAFDRAFLYGDGFFETTRIRGRRAMLLERHIKRLSGSCMATGWQWRPDAAEISGAVSRLIEINRVEDGYLRITVSRGLHSGDLVPPAALSPTVLIEARAAKLPPLNSCPPFRLARSPYRRNEYSPAVRHKSVSYQDNVLAIAEARKDGADEVYFLNTAGFLCEGAFTNLFWARNGELFTPSADCGLLPGITRGFILETAENESIRCCTGRYGEKELLDADEVFCTNSLRGVIPVIALKADDISRRWQTGPLSRLLAERYATADVNP